MDLVVNEWLPEYFCTDNPAARALLGRFLTRFKARGDRLFVLRPSPFLQKLLSFAKQCQTDENKYLAMKDFISLILQNTDYTTIIDNADALPPATEAVLQMPGTNYQSDRYLFQTALHTESKTIISTDVKLHNAMLADQHFRVVLLEDFLADY